MKLNHRILGKGKALIIVHGLFGSLDNWMTMAKKLAQNFQVHLVDLRNHGRSPHNENMNYQLMANDLAQFIDEHKLDEPMILGHSMGGKAAMQLALNEPNLIKKMVIVDIGVKEYPMHHQKILAGLNNLDLSAIRSRSMAEEQLMDHIEEPGVRQFLLKSLFRNNEGSYNLRFNLKSLEKNMLYILEEIYGDYVPTETLFIRGALSGYVLDEDIPGIKGLFPNSQVKTIEECGHWVHSEKPKEFYSLLIDFL